MIEEHSSEPIENESSGNQKSDSIGGQGYHTPVMLREAVEALHVAPGGIYVDATLGGGGYSEAILAQLRGEGKLYGFDTDPAAMQFATNRLAPFGNLFELVPQNFNEVEREMEEREVAGIAGIVYDLGVSSHQLDTASVGLSYRVSDAPLDMRLDPRLPRSAKEIINEEDEQRLKQIFYRYGEEPYSGPIARKIIEARKKGGPIITTGALAEIIINGIREDKKNATLSRIFQALRIEVNGELESLKVSLEAAIRLLQKGGRLVVVSYHSLEDRIVKELFQRESAPKAEAGSLLALKESIDHSRATLRLLTRKPLLPSAEEIELNPRARSAKLRVAEKI